MKAVLRLVGTYFTGTPVTRAFTFGGLALWGIALYILTTQAQSAAKLRVGIAGLAAIFIGSSLMPLMVGRLARSHSMTILPFGRLKLLISIFITVTLVSLPVAILTVFSFGAGLSVAATHWWADPRAYEYTLELGKLVFTSTFILAGWLYVALWFITSQRNVYGFAKGLAVFAIIALVPIRDLTAPSGLSPALAWYLQQIAVAWTLFGAGFLAWPRLKGFFARWRLPGFIRALNFSPRRVAGREIDLMLGTANPLLFIGAQAIPIIIALRFEMYLTTIWLYFLTIFSTVIGAVAGQAAQRSRGLWLRADWSRAELFVQVERSFWRHNGFVLGAILLLTVAIGAYAGLSSKLLVVGLPLLVLGTALSTYLGLMVTSGLRWIESVVGVLVMLAMTTLALVIVQQGLGTTQVFIFEAIFAVLVFVLREAARRRWGRIDWMECRAERTQVVRGAG